MPSQDYRLLQQGGGAAQEEEQLLLCEEAPTHIPLADSDASEEEGLYAESPVRRRTRLTKIALAIAGVALVASATHFRPTAQVILADMFGSVAEVAVSGDEGPACLCLFDVDRTLTAKQLDDASSDADQPEAQCEDVESSNAADFAFGGGRLRLSPLGHRIEETDCAKCKRGAISAGGVGGSAEQGIIAKELGLDNSWTSAASVASPLVRFCADGVKHLCTRNIVRWYSTFHKIDFKPEDVYVYDDAAVNIVEFSNTGYNAKQVSCGTRDGTVGLCGSSVEEIKLQKGVHFCGSGMRTK